MAKTLPLKLKDSDGNLQYISASDKKYIAYLAAKHLDSATTVGDITLTSTNNTSIGSFVDFYYNEVVGTHPASLITSTQTTTTLYQESGSASEGGDNWRLPVGYEDSDNTIHEMNTTNLTSFVDSISSIIATNEYPGSFRLATSAPSADWSVHIDSAFSDNINTGLVNSYNIYKRNTMTVPAEITDDLGGKSNIVSIKRSNGDSGDYEGLTLMTDDQVAYTIGEKIAERRAVAGNIGSYQLRSSAQGVPTDTGTWVARGTAENTRRVTGGQQYSRTRYSTFTDDYVGDYITEYVGVYARTYVGNYTGNFTRDFVGNYTGIVIDTYVGDYNRTFVGEYTNAGFVGNYTADYTGNFTRNYIGVYSRTRFSAYSRTRVSLFIGNYSRDFSRTRSSNYITTYTGNYAGNFTGDFARTSTRDSTSDFTRGPFTRDSIGDYIGEYATLFAGEYTGNYTNAGFVGDYTANYTADYSGEYTPNYVGIFVADSTFFYLGNFVGENEYVPTYTGNYTGHYTRDRFATYTGDYTGNYTTDYIATRSSFFSGISYVETYVGPATYVGFYASGGVATQINFTGDYISYAPAGTTYTGNYFDIKDYLGGNLNADYINYIRRRNTASPYYYTGDYLRTSIAIQFIGDFLRQGSPIIYSGNYLGATQYYTSNYTRTSVVQSFTGDFLGAPVDYPSDYIGLGPLWLGVLEGLSGQDTSLFWENVFDISTGGDYIGTNLYYYTDIDNPIISALLNLGASATSFTYGNTTWFRKSGAPAQEINDYPYKYERYKIARLAPEVDISYYTGNYLGTSYYVGDYTVINPSPMAAAMFTGEYTGGGTNNFVGDYARDVFYDYIGNLNYVANYVPGTPDDLGTTYQYTGNYVADYAGTSVVVSTNFFTGNYGNVDYVSASYSGYTSPFVGPYEYVAQFLGNYQGNFVGDYIGDDFTRTRTSSYTRGPFTRTRFSAYTRSSTRSRESTFAGNYAGNYVGNFTANYIGNFAGDFIGEFVSLSTRTSSRASNVVTSTADFIGEYATAFAGDYAVDYVGDYTNAGFAGDYSGNYTAEYTSISTRDFARTRFSTYTRDRVSAYAGNYTRERESAFARTRVSSYATDFVRNRVVSTSTGYTENYAGNYVGNYTNTVSGGFVGNYLGTTIGSNTEVAETYTLYVRVA